VFIVVLYNSKYGWMVEVVVGYIGYELSRSRVATNMCTYGHAVTRRVALNLYPFALYRAPSACCSQQLWVSIVGEKIVPTAGATANGASGFWLLLGAMALAMIVPSPTTWPKNKIRNIMSDITSEVSRPV